MIPDGLEPSFSGCRPGVVAAGPRNRFVWEVDSPGVAPGSPVCRTGIFLLDHEPVVVRAVAHRLLSAEAVGLEPTNGGQPPPVFETGSSSGRMTSVIGNCGGRTRTCGLVIQSHGFLPAETTPHQEVSRGWWVVGSQNRIQRSGLAWRSTTHPLSTSFRVPCGS